jgi:hypothetical protein
MSNDEDPQKLVVFRDNFHEFLVLADGFNLSFPILIFQSQNHVPSFVMFSIRRPFPLKTEVWRLWRQLWRQWKLERSDGG